MTQQMGQRIGYARVPSTDQNLARQVAALGDVNFPLGGTITQKRQPDGIRAAEARGVYPCQLPRTTVGC